MEKTKKMGVIKKSALGLIPLSMKKQVGEKDEIGVWKYELPTDDCLAPGQIAVLLDPEENIFYGIPKNAVNWR